MSRQWMLPDGGFLHDASARQYEVPSGIVDEAIAAAVVVQKYAAEYNAGPPMRGAPWLQHLPRTPNPTNPPLPVPRPQIYAPEINGGPPLRIAPWLQHLPIQPGDTKLSPAATAPPMQAYPPEIKAGPPLRGAPWLQRLPIEPSQKIAPGPPASAGSTIIAPEIVHGPPMRGAPWVIVLPTSTTSSVPPIPPRPPPARSRSLALIEKDLTADSRLRRFTDLVSEFFNSLAGQGVIVQVGGRNWRLAGAGAFTGKGAPTSAYDRSAGFYRGCLYSDDDTSIIYICVRDDIGFAVWDTVSISSTSGLTGTFP